MKPFLGSQQAARGIARGLGALCHRVSVADSCTQGLLLHGPPALTRRWYWLSAAVTPDRRQPAGAAADRRRTPAADRQRPESSRSGLAGPALPEATLARPTKPSRLSLGNLTTRGLAFFAPGPSSPRERRWRTSGALRPDIRRHRRDAGRGRASRGSALASAGRATPRLGNGGPRAVRGLPTAPRTACRLANRLRPLPPAARPGPPPAGRSGPPWRWARAGSVSCREPRSRVMRSDCCVRLRRP